MHSTENRLSVLGWATVTASGLLWIIPAVNSIAAVAGIVGLILIVARLGYVRGFWTALAGLALASGTSSLAIEYPAGLYYGLFYFLVVIAPAFMMGWASRNLYRPISVVCYGLIPLGILFLIFIYTYVDWMGDLPILVSSYLENLIKSRPELLNRVMEIYGSEVNALGLFSKDISQLVERLLKVVPGFLFTALLGVAVFSLVIAGSVASRSGVIISRFNPFHLWKASEWWLLPTIAGLIPVVFRMEELWYYIGLNVLIVAGHVYMVVGLSIVEAFFKRAVVPVSIKIIFYAVLVLAGPVSMAFLAILGLSDTKFGFKREIEEFENKE